MKLDSLYIASQEANSGTLFVSMGMMHILKRKLHRVAFFRPIILDKSKKDKDIEFMLGHYNLDMNYEDCYALDLDEVESLLAQNKQEEVLNTIIQKFQKLALEYDFVLCEGLRGTFFNATIHQDLNLLIAQNLNAAYINIINAKDLQEQEIEQNIAIEKERIESFKVQHFSTFVNRVNSSQKEKLTKKFAQDSLSVFFLEEIEELNKPTLLDIIESLNAKEIVVKKEDYSRVIFNTRIAALSVENFLEYIQEGDLIIVPADRSDIILGLLGAVYSNNYPSIAAILFPFDMEANSNIQKLIDGLDGFRIPIISIECDTYTSAQKLAKVRSRLRVDSTRKISLALGIFQENVDVSLVESKIATSYSDIVTPLMFEYKLFEMARKKKKHIILPESSDERILRAAQIILLRGVADITLLGNKKTIEQKVVGLGLDLTQAQILDYENSPLLEEFSQEFYKLRSHKGLSKEAAYDAMNNANYFATMMVHLGYGDGMVSGAIGSTGETILPALQIIKTKPNISLVSSVFFMCMETKVLVFGDCAVNQNPTAQELAQIAISSAQTVESFGIEPKVAMLSYSTGNSGKGEDVQKVQEATKIVKELNSSLLVDGPLQYDAAVNKEVAKKKMPNSKVAGEANVLIFPDLNTGNNTYKAVQRSSGAVAIGPVLQGLNKPVNDLSRGCLVEDIVNTIAITAIQAGE